MEPEIDEEMQVEEETRLRQEIEYDKRHSYRTGEYNLTHTTPQCGRCLGAIEQIGASCDPTNIAGLYVTESECFMHYSCYKELCDAELAKRVAREDTIVSDMKLAAEADRVEPYCTYDWTNPVDFRYCSYCHGQLTDRWPGCGYPCSDECANRDWRNYGFIHVTCYQKVRSQGKYNPEPAAVKPTRAVGLAPVPSFKGVAPKSRIIDTTTTTPQCQFYNWYQTETKQRQQQQEHNDKEDQERILSMETIEPPKIWVPDVGAFSGTHRRQEKELKKQQQQQQQQELKMDSIIISV